ncbi:MAG: hypothetical protein C5B57_11970 [Blastocatellia bacterium]|nr:MAG: hypothetical protein C5B57_11970 [Blastocatellia bacterium]
MRSSKIRSVCATGAVRVLVVSALMPSASWAAQSPPPAQGTVALEGTMKKFYRAANVVVVTTVDGVDHVYHFAKDLVVHGGKGSGVDAFAGLREGSTVVVHSTADGEEQVAREVDVIGGEGLKTTEGVVTRIDRGHRQISVRYDNGKTETFQLTERAAAETPTTNQSAATGGQVAIYYSDQHGQKVAHYFRKVSK